MKRSVTTFCLAAWFLASASVASAQVTTFFGDNNYVPPAGRDLTVPNNARNNFLAQFVTTGTDTFDTYPGSTSPFVPLPQNPYSIPSIPLTYTSNAFTVGADGSGFGTFSVTPTNFLAGSLLFDPGSGQFLGIGLTNNFVFSRKIDGFGIYFINIGDSFANSFTITLQDGPAGALRTYPINNFSDGSNVPLVFGPGRQPDATFFFGIKDTVPFDRVTITGVSASSGFDGVIFDDLSVGFISAVPEPSTYALIGGLALVVYGRHRYLKRKERLSLAR